MQRPRFSALSFARKSATFEQQRQMSSRQSQVESFVKKPIFENSVGVLILLSVLLIAIEVQYQASTKKASPMVFEVSSVAFTVVFFIELVIRLFVTGCAFFSWQTSGFLWNWLDTIFVLSGMLEFVYMIVGADATSSSIVGALRVARLIRVARMLRVMRVVRSSPYFEELRVMLHAIMSAGGAIMWSMSILCALLFIVACILTQATTNFMLAHDLSSQHRACSDLDSFFGSVPKALVTMFLSVTGGVNWSGPLDCISSIHISYGVVFFIAVCFCLIAMLNIVNGFFVESAMQAAKADRQHKVAEVARNKQKYIDELRRVFRLIDQDGSNQITFKEFKRCVEHQEFQDYLAAFDLDIEAGEEIFHLLDANSDGTVTFEEFVQGCMRFRGQATAMDIASVRQDVKRLAARVSKLMIQASTSEGMGGEVTQV